jgi:hypothetical protein
MFDDVRLTRDRPSFRHGCHRLPVRVLECYCNGLLASGVYTLYYYVLP